MIGQQAQAAGPGAHRYDVQTGPVNNTPLSPVEEALARVTGMINSVEEQVNSLRERLKPILGPSRPNAVPENKGPVSDIPLCTDLETKYERLYRICSELEELRSRVGV